VIISKEGYIVTNGHVVGAGRRGRAEGITVTLSDGRQFTAKLIGADNATILP